MKVTDFIIKTFSSKKIMSNEKDFKNFIEMKKTSKKYTFPNIKLKSTIEREQINTNDVYQFNNKRSDRIIIYLHGGAFVNDASIFHLKFMDKISLESNIPLYFPIYPLVPNDTYKEAYEMLLILYKRLINDNKEIILMGDSAGGGLALSFTEYLKELEMKLPIKLILISPWVDVSLSNESLKSYEKIDPMLSIYGLTECGKLWANDLDLKNYKVSPIYGNLSHLPDILLFVGTKEIFYPDVILLDQKIKECQGNSTLIVGEDLNHIYPLYPTKKENNACQEILNFIKKN